MTQKQKGGRASRSMLLVACVSLVVALGLSLPALATAKTAPTATAAGGICTVGIINGEGAYSGYIPYYGAGALLQPTLTITNVNFLGFQGSAQFWVYYPGVHVDLGLHLLPWRSSSISGIAATTPRPNTKGLPFRIWISADSDAVGLAYSVCV